MADHDTNTAGEEAQDEDVLSSLLDEWFVDPGSSAGDSMHASRSAVVRSGGVGGLTRGEGYHTAGELSVGAGRAPEPGRRLGRCQLFTEIGRGGACVVYRAEHRTLKTPVAVKILMAEGDALAAAVETLASEARLLARLNHHNVVRVLDFEDQGEYPYLVLEYVGGSNLLREIERLGKFSAREASAVIAQTAAGLGEVHRLGIIHRDIKPANILITENGVPKVADLGLALSAVRHRPILGEQKLAEGQIQGTVPYMSPEQATAPNGVDHRADIYSLGVTFFQAVTGRLPFEAKSPMQVLWKHANEEPPAPHDLVAVDPRISEVILKMMAKKPDDRFQSCTEVIEALGGKTLQSRGMMLSAGDGSMNATVTDHLTTKSPAVGQGATLGGHSILFVSGEAEAGGYRLDKLAAALRQRGAEVSSDWGGPAQAVCAPDLLIGVLPAGERRLPGHVNQMLETYFPGVPLLLLCRGPLKRKVMTLDQGSITLARTSNDPDRVAELADGIIRRRADGDAPMGRGASCLDYWACLLACRPGRDEISWMRRMQASAGTAAMNLPGGTSVSLAGDADRWLLDVSEGADVWLISPTRRPELWNVPTGTQWEGEVQPGEMVVAVSEAQGHSSLAGLADGPSADEALREAAATDGNTLAKALLARLKEQPHPFLAAVLEPLK